MRQAMPMVSLLFLLLLLEESQGISLRGGSLAIFHKRIINKECLKGEESATEVLCKEDEPCSGRVRKLMMKAMTASKVSTRQAPLQSEKNNEKEIAHDSVKEIAHDSVKGIDKSKKTKKFHVEPPQTYPDVLGIDVTDYSPAKRKPPIHQKPLPTSRAHTQIERRNIEKEIAHHSIEEAKKSKKPEKFHVKPPEPYPDVLDIAGMDYSPARRKPPIHN